MRHPRGIPLGPANPRCDRGDARSVVVIALLVAVALACAVLSLVIENGMWLLAISGVAVVAAFFVARSTKHRHP